MYFGMYYVLQQSNKPDKKFMVTTPPDKFTGRTKTIHFGYRPMSDMLQHRDPERKERYIKRHAKRENWTKSGINTAGFWSKHILWNLSTLNKSIKDTEKNFNIKIKLLK